MNLQEQYKWVLGEIKKCRELGEYHEIPALEEELKNIHKQLRRSRQSPNYEEPLTDFDMEGDDII